MQTDAKDYLFSGSLIALVLAATALVLWVVDGLLLPLLGAFAGIVLFAASALAYGGLTAILLGLLSVRFPLREGLYNLDDPQFTLWKVQHVVGELGKVALSLFFPVFARAGFYALFGASVGKQVAVAGKILDPRLTILDDRCVLGEGCIVTSHAIAAGRFLLRAVHVGKGATVGVGCIIMPGVRIGAGAIILPGSLLKADTAVPPGETWGGMPAVRMRAAPD